MLILSKLQLLYLRKSKKLITLLKLNPTLPIATKQLNFRLTKKLKNNLNLRLKKLKNWHKLKPKRLFHNQMRNNFLRLNLLSSKNQQKKFKNLRRLRNLNK